MVRARTRRDQRPPRGSGSTDEAAARRCYERVAVGELDAAAWRPSPDVRPGLPLGWRAVKDPATNETYYNEVETGLVQWTAPPAPPPPFEPIKDADCAAAFTKRGAGIKARLRDVAKDLAGPGGSAIAGVGRALRYYYAVFKPSDAYPAAKAASRADFSDSDDDDVRSEQGTEAPRTRLSTRARRRSDVETSSSKRRRSRSSVDPIVELRKVLSTGELAEWQSFGLREDDDPIKKRSLLESPVAQASGAWDERSRRWTSGR